MEGIDRIVTELRTFYEQTRFVFFAQSILDRMGMKSYNDTKQQSVLLRFNRFL